LGIAGRNYPGPGLEREEEQSHLTTAIISDRKPGLSENGIESDQIEVNFLMARGYDKPFEGRG
jgi:hypothetical protein